MAYKTPAWQRKAGKNPKGGLNAKGRASYKGGTLKAPVKSGDNPRRVATILVEHLSLLEWVTWQGLNIRMVSQLDFF